MLHCAHAGINKCLTFSKCPLLMKKSASEFHSCPKLSENRRKPPRIMSATFRLLILNKSRKRSSFHSQTVIIYLSCETEVSCSFFSVRKSKEPLSRRVSFILKSISTFFEDNKSRMNKTFSIIQYLKNFHDCYCHAQ